MRTIANEFLIASKAPGSTVTVPVQSETLTGHFCVPANAGAAVLVAHTSLENSHAQQSEMVFQQLTSEGIAVLEVDLIETREKISEPDAENFCDLGLQALRIVTAIQWMSRQRTLRNLRFGCIGLGSGGTAALIAAGAFSGSIRALVVADAQPDLVGDRLMNIHAPTLLIAGATHDLHQRMNEIGYARLLCKKELELLLRNSHSDPDDEMKRIAALARDWFIQHLISPRNGSGKSRGVGETFAFSTK